MSGGNQQDALKIYTCAIELCRRFDPYPATQVHITVSRTEDVDRSHNIGPVRLAEEMFGEDRPSITSRQPLFYRQMVFDVEVFLAIEGHGANLILRRNQQNIFVMQQVFRVENRLHSAVQGAQHRGYTIRE